MKKINPDKEIINNPSYSTFNLLITEILKLVEFPVAITYFEIENGCKSPLECGNEIDYFDLNLTSFYLDLSAFHIIRVYLIKERRWNEKNESQDSFEIRIYNDNHQLGCEFTFKFKITPQKQKSFFDQIKLNYALNLEQAEFPDFFVAYPLVLSSDGYFGDVARQPCFNNKFRQEINKRILKRLKLKTIDQNDLEKRYGLNPFSFKFEYSPRRMHCYYNLTPSLGNETFPHAQINRLNLCARLEFDPDDFLCRLRIFFLEYNCEHASYQFWYEKPTKNMIWKRDMPWNCIRNAQELYFKILREGITPSIVEKMPSLLNLLRAFSSGEKTGDQTFQFQFYHQFLQAITPSSKLDYNSLIQNQFRLKILWSISNPNTNDQYIQKLPKHPNIYQIPNTNDQYIQNLQKNPIIYQITENAILEHSLLDLEYTPLQNGFYDIETKIPHSVKYVLHSPHFSLNLAKFLFGFKLYFMEFYLSQVKSPKEEFLLLCQKILKQKQATLKRKDNLEYIQFLQAKFFNNKGE